MIGWRQEEILAGSSGLLVELYLNDFIRHLSSPVHYSLTSCYGRAEQTSEVERGQMGPHRREDIPLTRSQAKNEGKARSASYLAKFK